MFPDFLHVFTDGIVLSDKDKLPVAYYLLTGQPPFVRPTPLQTLVAHACDPPTPPDRLRADVPPDLQMVVLRCLEKDPAQRFPTARSLDAALAGCLAAGLWTEERASAWWRGQAGWADDGNSVADTTTRMAEPGTTAERSGEG